MRQSLVLAIIATLALGSRPAFADEPRPATGSQLAAGVRLALRETARQHEPDDAAIRRLTDHYQALMKDTSLPAAERQRLRIAVLGRLKAWQKVLAQQALPGLPGGGPNGQPQAPVDHGQELLELIQDTIAPDSWDVRGGPGVIRYWGGGHAMVIRQTGEVHEALGQLLVDLR
jgi:hypothetical protein